VAHLEFFIQHTLPRIRPSFVVATGDLTDAKDELQLAGQQYEEEWVAYRNILAAHQLDTKNNGKYWLDLRGNHDCFSVPTKDESFFHVYGVQGSHESYMVHRSSSLAHTRSLPSTAVPRWALRGT